MHEIKGQKNLVNYGLQVLGVQSVWLQLQVVEHRFFKVLENQKQLALLAEGLIEAHDVCVLVLLQKLDLPQHCFAHLLFRQALRARRLHLTP